MISPQKRRWRAAAYTLTEMLVVLVIIGLLAAIVGPRLFSRLDDAKVRTARLQMASLKSAVDLFRLDVGRLPSAEEGMGVLVEAPPAEANWLGPYLARDQLPQDPWGNPYVYEIEADGYRIVSYGADGREGGADANADIVETIDDAPQATISGGSADDEAPTQRVE